MCKNDSQCSRGQRCINGVCTVAARRPTLRWVLSLLCTMLGACVTPAAGAKPDEPFLIKAGVGYSSQIGTAEGQEAPDSDFAADPAPSTGRSESFARTNQEALAAVEQGQGGVHCANGTTERLPDGSCKYSDFDTARTCESLRLAASETVQACAAEVTNNSCLRTNGRYQASECPQCAALEGLDSQLSDRGCPQRERYPVLREGK